MTTKKKKVDKRTLRKPPPVRVQAQKKKETYDREVLEGCREMDKAEMKALVRYSFRLSDLQNALKAKRRNLKKYNLSYSVLEKQLAKANQWQLKEYRGIFEVIAHLPQNIPSQWARSMELGPRTAVGLLAYVNPDKARNVSQLVSYAGLQPQNRNRKAVRGYWIRKALYEAKQRYESPDDPDCIAYCSAILHRPKKRLTEMVAKSIASRGSITWNAFEYILWSPSYEPTFRRILKGIMVYFDLRRVSGLYYRDRFVERYQYEWNRNESGANKDLAESILYTVGDSIRKTTPGYKMLTEGKLPTLHLHIRAQLWTMKLLLSHYLEVAYFHKYKGNKRPDEPYILWRINDDKDRKIPVPNWPWSKGNES